MGKSNNKNYDYISKNFNLHDVTDFNRAFSSNLDPGEVAYVVCTAFKKFKTVLGLKKMYS